jgi:plasmid stabilization system protein ParE
VASLRLHPEAEVDVAEAAVWYEQCQKGLGSDFLAELERSFTMILEAPTTWSPWPGLEPNLGIRRFLLARFPYGIAYELAGEDIIVFAVAHLARRPGFWKSRMKG